MKLKSAIDLIINGNRNLNLQGLEPSATAFAVSNIATNHNRPTFIITPDSETGENIYNDLQFYLPNEKKDLLCQFPSPDTLPYTHLKTQDDIWSDRLKILYQLHIKEPLIIVASISSILRRVIPKMNFLDYVLEFRRGEEIDREYLIKKLSESGYLNVSIVEDAGTFALRGGIIDIFTPTLDFPVRLEFDGDKIESIRLFDPSTQRSKDEIFKFTIIPSKDVILNEKTKLQALSQISELTKKESLPLDKKRQLREYIEEGIYFTGIETTLPIYYNKTSTVFDYLPNDSIVTLINKDSIKHNAEKEFEKAIELHSECNNIEKIIPPDMLYIGIDDIYNICKKYQCIKFNHLTIHSGEKEDTDTLNFTTENNSDLKTILLKHKSNEDILKPLVSKMKKWLDGDNKIVLGCHTNIQAERMLDLFKWHKLPIETSDLDFNEVLNLKQKKIWIKLGKLSRGFKWFDEGLILITDEEIFGKKTSRPRAQVYEEHFTNFSELSEGDHLVHTQHGVGRYIKLMNMEILGTKNDYIQMEYLGGDKLYIPIYKLNLLQKYMGPSETAPILDKLGGSGWLKEQKKAKKSIKIIAKDLLELYAKRALAKGFVFPVPDHYYEEFEATFQYDETPDQLTAIDDVNRDMSLEMPMDRLICGDVGYGKTEVAMRSAFRAVMAGKQVAVLVPTTILAFQHYENFISRFKDHPIKIDMLTRFRNKAEQNGIIKELAQGTMDIVIGTHRLLQRDIKFKNIGLLVVDEEQRFGVSHKEKIKELRTNLDILTLSATPIPRTLHMALTGIKDISIINTPPANRLSIRTFIAEFEDHVIREAIMREVKRGGQIFFLHNRVQTIQSMKDRLEKIVPNVKIGVAHGQMKSSELEDAMINFLQRKHDVLLCTTIIESGIDIPSANTLIVNRADTFGLAQLYQLRGRVGRSAQRAYAYFVIPSEATITDLAKRRLTTLQRYTELGSGFQIASHDLEIRGSGSLLGTAQSGHIAAIGYEMFDKLLKREIRKLQGKVEAEEIEPELNFRIEAFIPKDYIDNDGTRMDLYKRLSNLDSIQDLSEMESEIRDRFGELPERVVMLLKIIEIKINCKQLKVRSVSYDNNIFVFHFDESTPLNPDNILPIISENPMQITLRPNNKLLYQCKTADEKEIINKAKTFLTRLTNALT